MFVAIVSRSNRFWFYLSPYFNKTGLVLTWKMFKGPGTRSWLDQSDRFKRSIWKLLTPEHVFCFAKGKQNGYTTDPHPLKWWTLIKRYKRCLEYGITRLFFPCFQFSNYFLGFLLFPSRPFWIPNLLKTQRWFLKIELLRSGNGIDFLLLSIKLNYEPDFHCLRFGSNWRRCPHCPAFKEDHVRELPGAGVDWGWCRNHFIVEG